MSLQEYEDQRSTWLKSLKAGDKVVVSRGSWSDQIGEVEKVTPTRRITLKNGEKYNADGYKISKDSWDIGSIREYTEEYKKQKEHENKAKAVYNHMNRITQTNLTNLSLEDLEQLESIMKKLGLLK